MKTDDLRYCPFFGQLVWNVKRQGVSFGAISGSLNVEGYRQVTLNRKCYLAHRIIWELHHGPIPDGMEIDHRNGQRDCNYIWNLRLADRNENTHNRKQMSNNTSGVKGVSWCKVKKVWRTQVMVKGERHYKEFKCKIKAAEWVQAKRQKLHGKFTNHGT